MRPVSPKMTRRISLRIDTNNLPTSDGLHAPVSSKSYRPPLTPRVGIRPSIFGAIEFRNAVQAAENVKMQLKNDISESRHRRNLSMPPSMFAKRQASPDLESQSSAQKRAKKHHRPSDLADLVISANDEHRAPSPSPSHSSQDSMGVAEDYFSGLNLYVSKQHSDRNARFFNNQDNIADRHPTFRAPSQGLSLPSIAETDRLLRTSPPHSPLSPPTNDSLTPANSPRPSSRTSSRSRPRSPSPSLRSVMSDMQVHQRGSSYWSNNKIVKKIMFSWHVFEKNHQEISDFLQDVWQTLFPTLQNWSTKSISNIASSILAVPIVFLLRITLPVTEDDSLRVDDMVITVEADDDQSSNTASNATDGYINTFGDGDFTFERSPIEESIECKWSRWHVIVQSICATTFVALTLAGRV